MVRDREIGSSLKVDEGKEELEMIVTRHDQFTPPLNVINLYGEQECRTKKEVMMDNWNKVMEVISQIERKHELVIVLGDLNKPYNMNESNTKMTVGGKLIQELIDTDKYVLVKAMDNVINVPYTRYDPAPPDDEKKKSTLDLFIISKQLERHVDYNRGRISYS